MTSYNYFTLIQGKDFLKVLFKSSMKSLFILKNTLRLFFMKENQGKEKNI